MSPGLHVNAPLRTRAIVPLSKAAHLAAAARNNQSLHVHIVVVRSGMSPDPTAHAPATVRVGGIEG